MGIFDRFFGPPTKEKFAQLFMAARKSHAADHMSFDAEQFRIIVGDSVDGNIINLGNFFNEYRKLPAKDRKTYLAHVSKSMLFQIELPEDFAEASPNLRPKLWARAGIEKIDLDAQIRGGKRFKMPQYQVGSHLVS